MSDAPEQVDDSPINRSTINQLSVEQLDAFLDGIRVRRLQIVQKLEKVAKVKADDAELTVYLRFERAHKQAMKLLDKLAAEEAKAELVVNKCRVLAMEME